ncbi:restriction endonuclease subunit S [Providencia stuartii]|uniref:restriction endonuclease subunit S n=3 Tax=Providencia stuartii TaxID=588 RepID=UPI0025AAF2B6|nr:restriction endonuclease subunit S [Providencia stuartii]MDN0006373.1 restriction endonuclease subunit S [Providencia stuartii]MDT2015698.1 restriction endonuclease subunit S [Providencia stuartii]MDT2081685.1 restriction endonuclease subunit S [Providencia stuartii]
MVIKPLGEIINVLTDYHANGAYKKLKDNVELLEQEEFALMIRTTNLEAQDYENNLIYITKKAYDFLSKSKVYPNDLIMNKIANAGAIYFMPDLNRPVSLGMNLFLIRVNTKKANPFYVYSYLKENESYVKSFASGSTTKTITKDDVKKLKILLPPLAEQEKIAEILSTWDKAIATTEKLIDASQQQKKALMQQLLTGKKRLLDDSGKPFEGEWEWLKASELFKTVSKKNNSDSEELLSVTQDQGVLPRKILERRVVMPDGSTKGYKLVVPGNFIISLRSFQGGLEYSRYRGLVSPAYTVLEPVKPINNEFYKQYYKSYNFIGHLAVAVIGIRDGKQISYSDFSFLKLPYPKVKEQQKIAAVLTNADKEIELLQAKLAHLKDEKKALMQQLLTGKRRVKVDENVAA